MKGEMTEDERPPVFKSWRGWYSLVMIVAIVQIIIYTLVTYNFK